MINFKIVLFAPEIPANTGNIGRLCIGTNSQLHLIKPFKFFLNDKYLKRAGLDYWDKVELFVHDNWVDFLSFISSKGDVPPPNIYLCETDSSVIYTSPHYKQGDVFVFGRESAGLPKNVLDSGLTRIYIPMSPHIRSINLCNSVAIILYEAMRQIDFL